MGFEENKQESWDGSRVFELKTEGEAEQEEDESNGFKSKLSVPSFAVEKLIELGLAMLEYHSFSTSIIDLKEEREVTSTLSTISCVFSPPLLTTKSQGFLLQVTDESSSSPLSPIQTTLLVLDNIFCFVLDCLRKGNGEECKEL